MTFLVSALGALLPSALLLWYFYKSDLYPEPRGVLLLTFLCGILIVIPVLAVAIPLGFFQPVTAHPLVIGFYVAFLIAAVPEEFFKFMVLTGYSARNPAFDEPMDGIVYGATASLGFATLENILYVSMGGWQVALMRAFTAVPLHAGLGAIMGYYVGQARFNPSSGKTAWQGYWIAVLLHGLYDFPLLASRARHIQNFSQPEATSPQQEMMWLFFELTVLIVLAVTVVWTWLLVRKLRNDQLQLEAQSKYRFQRRHL